MRYNKIIMSYNDDVSGELAEDLLCLDENQLKLLNLLTDRNLLKKDLWWESLDDLNKFDDSEWLEIK